ncbi:MAG TPA: hypothetical protein VNZ01_14110 [Solirubrobacteraceae bacterium]|nr:hypothetical protein [Solirubrobacteraceae bacterium]
MSAPSGVDDAEIHALVKRLARPHSSGGDVVERAALLASGGDFAAIMTWIADHDGVAEAMVAEAPRRGLHGPRLGLSGGAERRTPLRFVLPAGTLS